MKPSSFFFALCIPAAALASGPEDWKFVGKVSGDVELRINLNDAVREGSTVTFWTNQNFPERGRFGELSVRSKWTVNCSEKDFKLRAGTLYEERNGKGEVINVQIKPPDRWAPVSSSVVLTPLMPIVCLM